VNGEDAAQETLPAAAPSAAAGVSAHRWLVLVLVCTAQFMCVLDDTIVGIALPSIQHSLGFSGASLQWVPTGYVLTFGGLLLLGGRACDFFVRRRVFLTGLVIFGASSLACGLSSAPIALVVARIVQGSGAALMSAAALAILTVTFTGPERNRAFGVWGGLSGAAGAMGVILGGVLTTWLSWQAVFFINVPVAAAVVGLSVRFIPASRAEKRPALDPFGAITLVAGLGLLIFAIVHTRQAGWGSAVTLACLVGAAILLAGFAVIETRHRAPLVPLGVFRLRNVTGGNACSLLLGGAMLATFYFLALYLQQVLGYSAIENGLAQLPIALAVIVSAGVSSQLISRFGFKPLLIVGFTLITGALVWFAQIDVHGGYISDVLGPALLAGAGLGTTLVSFVTAATHDLAGDDEAGLASGLANTTTQLGGALGLAVVFTAAFARINTATATAPDTPAGPAALTSGFQLAFYIGAGVAAAGIIVALLVTTRPEKTTMVTGTGAFDAG
jgi:EmrB/QacA subfamily drug resistance transporter